MKYLSVIAILVVLASTPAYGQGAFLDRGFSVDAAGYSSDRSPLLGLSVGYTTGRIEAGVAVSEFKEHADPSLDIRSLTPFLGVYPLKQSQGAPITLRIGASVDFHRFSGTSFAASEASGETIGIDVAVFRSGGRLLGATFSPSLNLSGATSQVRLHGLSEREEVFQAGLDVSAVWGIGPRSMIVASPGVAVSDDGALAFGASLGFLSGRVER